jgi:hypothetical protein
MLTKRQIEACLVLAMQDRGCVQEILSNPECKWRIAWEARESTMCKLIEELEHMLQDETIEVAC